jgi:gamma-carbonic anhydrase
VQTPRPALGLSFDTMSELERQFEMFLRRAPRLGREVYMAQGAVVLGDVTLGDYASVWFNAVLRGDINRIAVGHHTNLQDTAVVHVSEDRPCLVGDYVTVGHGAILHACTVGNEALVGMGATILDGAVIGEQCLVGARALVTQGAQIPAGSLVLGAPARVVRALKAEERASFRDHAEKYAQVAAYYLRHRIG